MMNAYWYIRASNVPWERVERFMRHYERTFGLLTPDEERVVEGAAFNTPWGYWMSGEYTFEAVVGLGRN